MAFSDVANCRKDRVRQCGNAICRKCELKSPLNARSKSITQSHFTPIFPAIARIKGPPVLSKKGFADRQGRRNLKNTWLFQVPISLYEDVSI